MSDFFDEIEAIHHVSFIVSDLNRSKVFYTEVLGLEIDPNRPKMSSEGLWLNINANQQIHLLLTDDPYRSVERPDHPGLDRHIALKATDFIKMKAHLDNNNISYTTSKSGRDALFFCDPDKNTLEILG